jgi:hypothetical protein
VQLPPLQRVNLVVIPDTSPACIHVGDGESCFPVLLVISSLCASSQVPRRVGHVTRGRGHDCRHHCGKFAFHSCHWYVAMHDVYFAIAHCWVCLVANTDYFFLVRTQLLSAVSPPTASAPASIRVKPAAATNADAKSLLVRVVVSVNATKE